MALRCLHARVRGKRDERGAIVLLTALLMPVLLVVAALAIDLGMHRVARADAQALADVVALDLARELDGRAIGDGIRADMDTAAARALERNSSVIGDERYPPELVVRLGRLEDGAFVEMDAGVPSAVHVTARTGVTYAFAGLTGNSHGEAARSAIGQSESSACFQIGSWAATVQPGVAPFFDDIVGQVLGNSVVQLAGYDGLATAWLQLADVVSAPSIDVGTVDEVAALDAVTVGDWYLAMAHALERDGALLQAEVLERAAVSAVGDVVIDLGGLLGLTTAADAALVTEFNALDLLVGTAFLANGTNLLDLHNLQASVPSVGVTNTRFRIIERPRRACNADEAETAQATLTSDAKLSMNIPLLKDGPVDLRLIGPDGKPDGDITLGLRFELAGARGRLTDFDCGPDTFTAEVRSELLQVFIDGEARIEGSVDVNLLGIGLVSVPVEFALRISTQTTRPADTEAETVGPILYPPQEYGEAWTATAHDGIHLPYIKVGLVPDTLDVGTVKVGPLTIDTNVLEAAVVPVLESVMGLLRAEFALVDPLVDKLNEILGPLAVGLGVSTAGVDFFGLPRPSCQHPSLSG